MEVVAEIHREALVRAPGILLKKRRKNGMSQEVQGEHKGTHRDY